MLHFGRSDLPQKKKGLKRISTTKAGVAGISPDLKGEDLLRVVQQWIDQQANWLLILDSAGNALQGQRKPLVRCCILSLLGYFEYS